MNEIIVVTESTKKSKGRKYNCPYCNYRDFKPQLVDHIEKNHESMIPSDYTAARMVFNIANKKEHGTCVCGCGKETPWREDLWRYDRYASEECIDRYRKLVNQRMMSKYGKTKLLDDPEMQKKMLDNRSITRTYKFSSGGEMKCVGSYEEKFLKFCDEVMNYKARDIEQPGPLIPYTYKGKEHVWITDYYIPSANLVFDIKDGGSNPNTRDMEEYRGKQIAKEEAIKKQGKYNYVRLTDNNFAQLMLILAEIKERMLDSNNGEYEPVIHINESFGFLNPSIPSGESKLEAPTDFNNKALVENYIVKFMENCVVGIAPGGLRIPDTWVVNYTPKNTFIDNWAITDDEELTHMITTDKNGELVLVGRSLLGECVDYKVYKFNGPRGTMIEKPRNILEMLIGNEVISSDQIEYDDRFVKVTSPIRKDTIQEECVYATLSSISQNEIPIMTDICLSEDTLMTYTDKDGAYIRNSLTGMRSRSYDTFDSIPQDVIQYVKKGTI